MPTVTAQLDQHSMNMLAELAQTTQRSEALIVAEAVRHYLHDEKERIAAIKEGLEAAANGQFASADEVKAAFSRWGVDAR